MSNQSDEGGTLTKNIVVNSPAKIVFNAISNENELQKWGPANQRATLDKRIGGIIQFVTVREDTQETYIIRGNILEFVPDRKIPYTWRVDAQSDYHKTTVTWTLEPADNNKTNVTLVHSGIIKEEHTQLANAGWTYFLDRLVRYYKQDP
jgi:uncharacterized protein YndB with AHSA1/START domain